jgi:hypothetical protein
MPLSVVARCRPTLEGPLPVAASNREIAAELLLSVETVKSHVHVPFGLFDVPYVARHRKRAELVRRAFERGAVGCVPSQPRSFEGRSS